jgi:very-short-patch-repair endonuclease
VGGRTVARRLTPVARSLRRHATAAERRLWQGLRRAQVEAFRFRRQVILGGVIADFASFDARLVIEVDGATHSTAHSTAREVARDAARSAALAAEGYAVLRFTNDEVFRNLDGVLETIRALLMTLRPRIDDSRAEFGATPHPGPSPQGGRESVRSSKRARASI